MQYDLLIKNGYVVDYASAREGYFDVAVQNGMIAAVESSIGGSAVQELDASGKLVLPGLVDSHVHASAWLGGSYAHTMLVKAGVTSALDMSGPGTSVLELAREYGTGLNLATIEYVRPGHTVSSDDPSSAELQQLITKVQRQGSLGIKLLGGHYPLMVAATARAIRAAAELGAYTAFHAGTAAHGSNIEGMLEAVELAKGFGGEDDSPRFVNGVLGRIARSMEGDGAGAVGVAGADAAAAGPVDALVGASGAAACVQVGV